MKYLRGKNLETKVLRDKVLCSKALQSKDLREKKFADIDIYPVTCEALSCGRSNIDILHGIIGRSRRQNRATSREDCGVGS